MSVAPSLKLCNHHSTGQVNAHFCCATADVSECPEWLPPVPVLCCSDSLFLNIFQIFYPETTDIYDRKNMPRCIYCIHALRYSLNPIQTTVSSCCVGLWFYEVTGAVVQQNVTEWFTLGSRCCPSLYAPRQKPGPNTKLQHLYCRLLYLWWAQIPLGLNVSVPVVRL